MKIDKLVQSASVHFEPDEEPLSAVLGFYDARTSSGGGKRKGILAATNLRMIFFAKKIGGVDLETFSYDDVSRIEVSGRAWMGDAIRFVASGQSILMKWITAGNVDQLVAAVREIIGDEASPSTDAPDEAGPERPPSASRAAPSDAGAGLDPAGGRAPRMETVILRAAAANGGSITPAAIAADGEYSLEECKEHLQNLVSKGYAELRVRDSGAVFYAFPDMPSNSAAETPAAKPPVAPPEPDRPAADEPTADEPPRPAPRDRPRPVRATRKPQWIPAGESAIVAGREIGGMVYVGRGPLINGEPDNAFIDPTKPVAVKADDPGAEGMSYWPNYSSIHPRSRATYLAWLAGGRSDPGVNVGYVFLYFYGLERRFFVTGADPDEQAAIMAEADRLRSVCGSNRSARNYLDSFLQAAHAVIGETGDWTPVFERSGHELPITVRLAVGCMLRDSQPIPAQWMLSWLMTHPETRLRTPAVRAFPEFRALFEARFHERFPDGLSVDAPRRTLSLSYQAASMNFDVDIKPRIDGGGIPDIADLSKPLARVLPIAEQATDDLLKFSRYLGRNPDGRGTIEAHALLPDDLHGLFPCPELDELKAWARRQMEAGGLAPVADLIERLEGAPPEKIGKRQLTGAADALARLSIGMAPDPRFALRSPKLGEPVMLFPLPAGITRLEEVSAHYPPALLSLVMGAFVAHADGAVSDLERRHLIERVRSSNVLTESEKARLQANLDWMMAVPPDLTPIRRRVKDVGDEVRHGLGRLALAVVGADGVVDPAEIKAIEKLYRILGIEPDDVYRDLHALAAATEPVTVFRPTAAEPEYAVPPQPEDPAADRSAPIVLDQERVAAIMADTTEVSNVLHAVFSDDADDAEEERPEAQDADDRSDRFAGLDASHRGLAEELMRQPSWTPQEFEKLARRFRLMPAGALETINEWAFERYEAGLIDDGGNLSVNRGILDVPAA